VKAIVLNNLRLVNLFDKAGDLLTIVRLGQLSPTFKRHLPRHAAENSALDPLDALFAEWR
jgi:hypothetical protein